MRIFRILLLNLVLSAFAIILVVSLLKIDRSQFSPLPAVTEMLAWPLFVVGTLIIISAAYTLSKYSGATGALGDPTRNLVVVGPYRWLRNPIYAGDILLLFGVAFFLSSFLLFFLACVSIPAFHFVVCLIEEPRTEKRLGAEYRKYKQKVPRWIPNTSLWSEKSNE